MDKKYTLRDLPLSMGDAVILEDFANGTNRSIRAIMPFIDRYIILPAGQTVQDIPLSDLGVIIEGILNRQGIGKQDLKRSRRG